MKNLFYPLIWILSVLMIASCKKESVPEVSTKSVTAVTAITAEVRGEVLDDGGAPVTSKGFCWKVYEDPTIDDDKILAQGESNSFTGILSLSPSTTYYVRAYVTNSAGTGYGESVSFKTLGDKPLSNTSAATDISINSATLNGTVNPNSLSTIVSFEYGLTTNYGNTITASQSPLNGDSNKNVTIALTGLNPGKIYHYRIKSENSLGITYSDDMTFTTQGKVPAISPGDPTNISVSTAKLNAFLNPNFLTTSVIFEWGIDSNYGSTIIPIQSPVNGNTAISLSVDLSGLSKGTRYYYRISATNELGTSQTTGLSFTTFDVPKIITKDISEIKTTSAKIGGEILSDYGSPVSERGICWSTSLNPSVSDNKVPGTLEGPNYTISLTGLSPNSTYYLRSYAINGVGLSYGNEKVLKTYT